LEIYCPRSSWSSIKDVDSQRVKLHKLKANQSIEASSVGPILRLLLTQVLQRGVSSFFQSKSLPASRWTASDFSWAKAWAGTPSAIENVSNFKAFCLDAGIARAVETLDRHF
jgi:hypothetical protein